MSEAREQSYERLLALLEQASAGEWALDKQIAVLEREKIGDCADDEVPPYTTSLDAALSLVPEGAEYMISTLYGEADVELPLNFSDREPERVRRKDGNVILAVVQCALKARSAR